MATVSTYQYENSFPHMKSELINWKTKTEAVSKLSADIYSLQEKMLVANPGNPRFFREAEQTLNRMVANHKQLQQLFDVTQQSNADHRSNQLIQSHLDRIEREVNEVRKQLRHAAIRCAIGSRDVKYLKDGLQSTTHTLALSLKQLCHYLETSGFNVNNAVLLSFVPDSTSAKLPRNGTSHR
jgi:uncharacterized membrane protein YgaE (UPF0421/DUF939 family)